MVLIAFTVGFHGCTPTAKVMKDRTLSADEVLNRVRERNATIHTLRGDGSITIESPEVSNSGSFDMNLKKPDSLRVELTGPFGIHIGTLMLSREQFLFYNWMEKRAVIGKPDGKTLNSMFRLRMQFDEVLHAFTGEFPAPNDGDSIAHFSVEQGLYVVRYRLAQGAKEYRIDGDTFIVSSYRVWDTTGTLALSAFALQPDEGEPVVMPRLLRLVFPKDHRSVTISYDDIHLNEPVVCSFKLPQQAEMIYR